MTFCSVASQRHHFYFCRKKHVICNFQVEIQFNIYFIVIIVIGTYKLEHLINLSVLVN